MRGNFQIEFPYDRQRDLFIAFNCHHEISHRLYKFPTLVCDIFWDWMIIILQLQNHIVVWSAYLYSVLTDAGTSTNSWKQQLPKFQVAYWKTIVAASCLLVPMASSKCNILSLSNLHLLRTNTFMTLRKLRLGFPTSSSMCFLKQKVMIHDNHSGLNAL